MTLIPSQKYFTVSITLEEISRQRKLQNLVDLLTCRIADAHLTELENENCKNGND